ncbi:gamma-glutamyltransferase [Streptomyces sp. CB01881]|uniref:gamma-glutamyltransferase n=1 Tax=Streptomyces sp. CB01881 TaxID=2078691 RepID=UPI000CDC7970|nr:gamma-glutamyltransferase [Streptomyces sp. CB01881]AUY48871.1 gamma-glutamyltransferase [Streptomyces sp. CB01881]TYC77360.1 gamma-glutamyltransferase [Streptomyces sp. CB01881]
MRALARIAPPLLLATALVCSVAGPATAAGPPVQSPPKVPEAVGWGGAVASVDADATAAGIEVLRKGGNAVDAAVAVAAALGVTEPYSAGIGGGGYFVYYDHATGRVSTIDGRETASRTADEGLFLEGGKPLPFADAVTSGLSVGVPGSPATWETAVRLWGRRSFADALKPAQRIADQGFTVDQTFQDQTALNQARFKDFPDTAKLFLPGGDLPVVGSTFRNPDLAATYRQLGKEGTKALYQGDLATDIVRTIQHPPVDPASGRNARPGRVDATDLAGYQAKRQQPTHVAYRDYDLYSIAPSSSGGTTVGEALGILEDGEVGRYDGTQYYHHFLDASRIAFADRNRWVGDPAFNDVPVKELLSERYAASRACLISPDRALTSPLAPGDPRHPAACASAGPAPAAEPYEGLSTSHLTVADRWGNVVSYTLTLEQTGGSGITVPGRGFLLNNELTDFNFTPLTPGVPDPNLPGPGKRPRSSLSPTIVLRDGEPVLAAGSPGGATIITTTLQVLLGRLDRGLSLEQAIAAPRASQRNTAATQAEPAFLALPERARLEALGHVFASTPEIGAATGVERLPDGRWVAAAEPVRRGGGAAAVVRPAP